MNLTLVLLMCVMGHHTALRSFVVAFAVSYARMNSLTAQTSVLIAPTSSIVHSSVSSPHAASQEVHFLPSHHLRDAIGST